jgi:hypothetical protein
MTDTTLEEERAKLLAIIERLQKLIEDDGEITTEHHQLLAMVIRLEEWLRS